MPFARPVALYVATPLLFRVEVPSRVVPSMKRTLPVGTTVPDEVGTVPVNVTEPPGAMIVAEAVRTVEDAAAFVIVSGWYAALAAKNTLSPL